MTVSRIEQRRPFSRGVWELYGSLDIFDAANEERFPIAHLPYIAVVAEVAAIAAIIFGTRRVRQALGGAGKELDIPERIHEAVAQSGMPARVASIVATEFSILYYALAVWRRNPFVPAHAHAFSYHRRSGLVAILYTILAAAAIELAALDLLLRARHRTAANAFLVVDAFAVLWILGLARAVTLRPILITPDELLIRGGIQWSLDVPRSAIDSVITGRVATPTKRTPGYLRTTLGQPNVLIGLSRPFVARGPYGITRSVTQVGLSLDDPNTFSLALATTPE
jgi:hypothetical protein